jgi:hypothetical protein
LEVIYWTITYSGFLFLFVVLYLYKRANLLRIISLLG